jgi:hypothetical protein
MSKADGRPRQFQIPRQVPGATLQYRLHCTAPHRDEPAAGSALSEREEEDEDEEEEDEGEDEGEDKWEWAAVLHSW